MSSGQFAKAHGVQSGDISVHTLEQSMFYFDSSDIVPQDRHNKEDWEPLAEALKLTREPEWYLTLIS